MMGFKTDLAGPLKDIPKIISVFWLDALGH